MAVLVQCGVHYVILLGFSILLQGCGGLPLHMKDAHEEAIIPKSVPDRDAKNIPGNTTGTAQASSGSSNDDVEHSSLQRKQTTVLTHGAYNQAAAKSRVAALSYTGAFSDISVAQAAVLDYLGRWRSRDSSDQKHIREQGKGILSGVELLKKTTKRSYRKQVLGFETHDIEPMVWHRVLLKQQKTKEQLKTLRELRSRLLDALQLSEQELALAGLRTAMREEVGEVTLYSSDEEAQQLSDQSRKTHAAFVTGVGRILRKHLQKKLLSLLDNAAGGGVVPHEALSSTPELPALLRGYVDSLHQGKNEEKRAELLGSLLTEAILQYFSLSKDNKTQLHRTKRELGKVAYQVACQYNSA